MVRNGKLFSIIALVVIAVMAYTALYGLGPIKSVQESIKLGLDIEGGVVVVYEAQTDATGDDLDRIMNQTKGVLGRRVDQLGLTEPNISIQGEDRIRIELPGVKEVQEAVALIGQTAQLSFVKVSEESFALPDMTIDEFEGELVLTGDMVKDSGIGSDQYGNPAVTLELDSDGTVLFRDATQEIATTYTYGEGQIAILLDDIVISAPIVDEIIPSGSAIISGNFGLDYASNLSALIRGGALPVNLEEVQTSLIGPTLGKDALQYSVYAAGIGLLLVVLFMIGYYRLPGVIATLSLILYGSIVMFIFTGLNATLTLPGMAGLVLSIGMAVDANVIIYERIKEELRVGKTIRASIDAAFKRALRTIMDANITTLIAAVVLYYFGEGPIQGFAITLMIGIMTSMFTAIIITRLLLKNVALMKAFNKKSFFGIRGESEKKWAQNIRFAGRLKIWSMLSLAVVVVGLVFSMMSGVNLGIDFTGGTMMHFDMEEVVEVEDVQAVIEPFDIEPDVIHAGLDNTEIIIKTKASLGNEERMEIFQAVSDAYGLDASHFLEAEQFGPSIGEEIQSKALTSILIAAVGMLIYITFRFELIYGITSIVALIHDVLILLAVYAIFGIPINSSFIAAVLTIVGYSINDTIVVFDRVRENVKLIKKATFTEIADTSLHQTLARSINTSLTTLLVIGSLYVLGVESIKEFAFPLMAGVIVGTYSSIFIASPLWAFFKDRSKKLRYKKA